uniref:Ig-like domain-containing protein n=1 Tax=Castor canadensis TaxID=51338 RepID=A0A8C0ZMV1_CASCN
MENVSQCVFISLWHQLGWLHGKVEVEHSPEILRLLEGDSGSLNCSHTTSYFQGLHWYKQDSGKGPRFLFRLYSIEHEKQNDRLKAMLSKKGSSVHITAPKPREDSAKYFCALWEDTVMEVTVKAEQKLRQ